VAHVLAEVGIAVCVGAVVVVWVAGAVYNAIHARHDESHAPRGLPRSQPGLTAGDGGLIVVAVVFVGLAVAGRSHLDGLTVGALWVRVLGLAVLVVSTVFTLWARFSLGTMWSNGPKVQGDRHLRTHGPYAVTRHPIYTGLLGIMLGATLLSGIGQWIVIFPAALIVFEVKIRMEEHLMLATFPDEYLRYRRQVPQLVPGLYTLRRRHSTSSYPWPACPEELHDWKRIKAPSPGPPGREADSLLCGDIQTEQGASIVRRHGGRKGNRRQRQRE
jgi:protein-S-isoprenylcysteine O-methyltransferase Ste14